MLNSKKSRAIFVAITSLVVIALLATTIFVFKDNIKSILSVIQKSKNNISEKSPEEFTPVLLTGSAPPSLEGFLQAAPDLIGQPGVDFQLLKTGKDDDWGKSPVPLVNPLGSMSLYSSAKHIPASKNGYYEMSYLDGYSQITHRYYGDRWEMRINDENLTTNYLRWYAKEIGATLYDNTDDRVTFSLKSKSGDQLWWATGVWNDPESKSCFIYVVKQDIAPLGKTITITPAENNGMCYFTTIAGDSDFITALVEISGEGPALADISAVQYTETGLLTRSFDYRKQLNTKLCSRYALDDIPQTGQPVYWSISLNTDKYKAEIVTIRFEKTGSIMPVKISDRMGGLRVVGAAGSAKVSSQSALNTNKHLDGFSYSGTVDKDGNTVFHLPTGYYNVRANLPGGGGGSVRMVPVNSGELTEIVLPDEFKSTYSSLESLYGNFNTNMGSILIQNNKDGGKTAEVSILINDPLKRDVFPEKENVTITEGGASAEITDIKRQTASVDIVLVIDTSGSMKDYMQPTIEAAKRFVAGLPDTTNIRLVSFEQKITEHKGNGKETVMKALDTLKASGGTSLYDATEKGISMLKGMDNAFVVVFSDGADSRELKNQGKGSNLNREQIMSKVKDSTATVLTIGFGDGHDPAALVAISDANKKGAYYAASDETMLDQAFAAVAGKFGNEFVIKYKRPEILTDVNSEQPVVGVMIDDSGSMDNYRDAAMTMFHDFFSKLPTGSLTQFSKFGDSVDMMHITTDQKALLLQAMSEKGETGGGTNVIKSLKAAVEQLRPLPTNKKVFIFLTDAAMSEVGVGQKNSDADKVFAHFREEGIRCLFVGVSNANRAEDSFKYAAEQTGGDYVITTDIAEVEKKLQELLGKVSIPLIDQELLPFTIGINAKTEDGSVMDYFATKKLEGFAPKKAAGTTQEPKAAKILTGGKMVPLYDKKSATLVGGGAKAGSEELKITGHINYEPEPEPEPEKDEGKPSTMTGSKAYSISGKNNLLEMTVKDVYTFDVLGGVTAHNSKQFFALNLELDFPKGKSEMEAYQIPSIEQHFYLSVNNGDTVPASKATWLAAEPLAAPGESSITVNKGSKKSGVLVFYGEKPATLTQLALHFYDTTNGHIEIPLAGKISDYLTSITELPTSTPAQITDAFSMTVTGKSDLEEDGENTILRTIEARFDSKVQALLNIDPEQRFYYSVDTSEGPLMTKMNNIVYNIPLGFTGKTMLAPGTSNKVYLPYEMPRLMASASSSIIGDVRSGSIKLPVTKGSPYKTSSEGLKFSHEYFDLTINALCPSSFSNSYAILDITVADKKDGFGTNGLDKIFALEYPAGSDKKYLTAHDKTKESLYGIDNDWAVFDGQTRRGIIIFSVSYDKPEQYVLRSPYFKDMAVKIANTPYAYPEILALEHPVKIDKTFDDSLNQAVAAAAKRYRANKPKTTKIPVQQVGLSPEENQGTDIPAPAASVFGESVLRSLSSEQDFYNLMYALRWLPAESQNYFYAPEAVITQAWGTQWDIYNLAENSLARLGIKSNYRVTNLTKKGKEALAFLSGVKDPKCNELPALAFTDQNGQSRIFVIPFMRDISELAGLVYLPSSQGKKGPSPATVKITIEASAEGAPEAAKASGQSGFFEAFAQATGSGETKDTEKVIKDIVLFQKNISIPSLSLGPVDIGYYIAAKSAEGGDLIKTVVDTTAGLLQGDAALDAGKDHVKAVTVKMDYAGSPSGGYTHTTILEEGQRLPDICHTLAFGLPEIHENAHALLQQVSEQQAKVEVTDASNASKVRWYTRGAIYRYIAASTQHDKDAASELQLVLGRVSQPLALMLTCRTDGNNAVASMDLMHHQNQVLQGEEDSIKAFRLFGGMFSSLLEGNALAEGSGVSILEIWSSLPQKTDFILVEDTKEARTLALEKMASAYPVVLLDNIKKALDTDSRTVFLVPEVAGKIGDKPRWAWLQIDSKTMDTVSVFDTGERSGIAGYTLGLMNVDDIRGHLGYFIGLSCGAWSISSYALETDNYPEIRAKSAILCAEILSKLEELLALADSGPLDYTKDKIKGKLEEMANEQLKEKVGDITIGDIKKYTNPKVTIPGGFSDGFKMAVRKYFGISL